MKNFLLAGAVSLLTAGSTMAQTVVLVRHAEKVDNGADPALSEAGQARARALATVLTDARPSHVFTSSLQRTSLTAGPTAEHHLTIIEPVSLEGGVAAHVVASAERVRALPADAVVLMVGHSNTVPLIARALGFEAAADMSECEYDRLTVLTLNGERTTALVGRYGTPTTCSYVP